jgi:hypothetical protein
MIALNSHDGGSLFYVYNDGELIGYLRRHSCLTGDRYMAMALVDKTEEKENREKEFYSPQDALQWIENYKGKSGSGYLA